MQRQGRINKLEQQQPCLHRNAEPSCCHRASFVSSGAVPGQSLDCLLWLHSITTHDSSWLACLPRLCQPSQYDCCPSYSARRPASTRAASSRYSGIHRCAVVIASGACSLVFAAAACCCSSGRWQARQDAQPLLSTRSSWLAAIGRADSSRMRPHRTVQPPPLTRGLQRRSNPAIVGV